MEAKVVISGDAAGLKLAISNAAVSLVELGATSRQAASSINAAMGRAEGDVGRLNKSLDTSQSLMGKLAGLAAGVISVAAIVSLAKEASALNLALERTSNTLRFASGSSQAYAANNEFLRTTVRALGLDLQSAGQQFASLTAAAKGTSLEGAGVRSIFDAVAKASTVMGLTADQTAGSLLAISQMISKGTVSAEELRGQLGERLPGAFQTAARAMGVTTAELGKLLESGALATDVFLPRFAAQMRLDMGGSVKEAADSVQANLNRVKTDWANLVTVVSNSTFSNETLKGIDQFLTVLTGTLQKSKDDFKGWGNDVADVLAFVGDAAASALNVVKFFGAGFSASSEIAELHIAKMKALDGLKYDYTAEGRAQALAIQSNYDAQRKAIKDGVTKTEEAMLSGGSRLRDALAKQRADQVADAPLKRRNEERKADEQRAADIALLATKPVLGGKDKKEAASAYDALSKSIEQTLALANEELASGEKLNAADKFRVTTINKLSEAYADGKITWDEWNKGYDKTILAADARALADNTTALNKYLEALREGNALTQMEIETGVVYSAAQKQALKILEEMTKGIREYSEEGAIALRVEMERSILQERVQAQRKAQFASDEKAFDSLQAEVQGLRDSNKAMDLHNQEIGLTKEALAALTLARQDEAIAVQASVVADYELVDAAQRDVAAMQLQINKLDELRRKRGLVAAGNSAELAADVNKRQVEDAKKVIEGIDKTAQDVWRSVFEGGSNAFEQIGKAIKREVIDVLYAMIAKKWVINIATSVAGALGFGGAAQAGNGLLGGIGGGGGLIGNLGSAATVGSQVIGGSMSVANGLGTLGANITGTGLEGLLASNGAYGTAAAVTEGATAVIAEGTAATVAGTTATTGLTAALGAIPVWGWAALGAVALFSMGGGGFKSSWSTGNTQINSDDSGKIAKQFSNQDGRPMTAESDKAALGLRDTYLATAKKLGIGTRATEFSYAGNSGAQGESPNFALSGGVVGLGGYTQGETKVTDEAVKLAASRAIFATLKNSDLPKYLAGIFDGLDASQMSQAQIETVLGTAQAFKGLHDQLETLPASFDQLKNASYPALKALVEVSGGFDKLTANLGTYYDKFYSDAEKTAATTAQVSKVFADLGIEMPALDQGARKAFRGIVEGLDLTKEADQKAYASLMAVAGAFDTIAPALDGVTTSVKNAVATLREQAKWQDKLDVLTGKSTQREISLRNDLADASNDTIKSLIRQVYAQEDSQAAAQAAAAAATSAAQTIKNAWAGIADSLMDEVRRLRGEMDAGAGDSLARVQAQFEITTAQARAGDQQAAKLLPTLAQTLDRVAQDNSTSLADVRRVQGRTAASLEETSRIISSISTAQLTTAGNAAVAGQSGGFAGVQDLAQPLAPPRDAGETNRNDRIQTLWLSADKYNVQGAQKLRADAVAAGITQADFAKAMGYTSLEVETYFSRYGVPAFANGGLHQGGVRLVGERGPELEFTGPSRILNQAQIGDALRAGGSGGADTKRLEALVETLTDEVITLRAIVQSVNINTLHTADSLRGNVPLLVEMAT